MTLEPMLRAIAGTFVGLNLPQSGFTTWCPMISFLRKLGVREMNKPVTT